MSEVIPSKDVAEDSGLLMQAHVLICQYVGLQNRNGLPAATTAREIYDGMRRWLVDFANGTDETNGDADIATMRELISAASQPPVDWGCVRGKTVEEHVADFRDSMSADTAAGVDLHGVYLGGTEIVVCHTGNGPTSEANAKLITFALNNLGRMVDEIERLRRVVGTASHAQQASSGAPAILRQGEIVGGLAPETTAGSSPLAQAVLDRVLAANVGMFLTAAVDHIEKGGSEASGEVELTDGTKVSLRMARVSSPPKAPDDPFSDLPVETV